MKVSRVSILTRLRQPSFVSSILPPSISLRLDDPIVGRDTRKTRIFPRQCPTVGFVSRSLHKLTQGPDDESSESSVCDEANSVCRILAEQKDSAGVAAALDRSGVIINPELAEEILRRLGNAGMLAWGFFRWAERQPGFLPSVGSFHALIDALGKIKQFRLIWSVVDSMRKQGVLTRDTFLLIVRRYARARKPDLAIGAFKRMSEFGLDPGVSDYNRLIDTIGKSRNVLKAQQVFNEAKRKKSFDPDVKTYTILMEAWGSTGNLQKVRDLFREMKSVGFEPDVVTYGILIGALCKAREYDAAVKEFREMEAGKNCEPSPHIYCTLINGLGSGERLEEAVRFFGESKEKGFDPELPTYNALIAAYCWAMRFQDAFRVMEEMTDRGVPPNSRTYGIVLRHLIRTGRSAEAYELFRRMLEDGSCEPDLDTYTMLVTMFCGAQKVDMAMKVWRKMTERGVLPCMHMFSALVRGLCDEYRMEEACTYFQEMLNRGIRPPGSMFSRLKQCLLDDGKKDLASNLETKLDRLRKVPLGM